MPDQWRQALGDLSEVGPDEGLLERARSSPPRGDLSPPRSRVVAIVVALVLFAASSVFVWRVFDPGSASTSAGVPGYPSPPASGQYILLPDHAVPADNFEVDVTAITNLPEGTLVAISTSTTGICCLPVEAGEVSFATQDSSCFGMVGDTPDDLTFDVSIAAKPSFEPWSIPGPVPDTGPPEQPAAVVSELGDDFGRLSGD